VLPTGAVPTLENVFAGIDVTTPATVNPEGANLARRQFNYQTPYTQTFNLTLLWIGRIVDILLPSKLSHHAFRYAVGIGLTDLVYQMDC
jgi:hypothetical protein